MTPWLAKHGGRLTLALAITITLILSAGLALDSYLDYANFKRAHTQLVTSRIRVPAQDLRHILETSLDFGLSLTQLRTLPQRLQEMLAADLDLSEITIQDSFGQVLFQVMRPGSTPTRAFPGTENKKSWQVVEPTRYVTGMIFKNSFQQPAGRLILAYDRSRIDRPVVAIEVDLLGEFILLFSILSLILTFGIYQLIKPLHTELSLIIQWLRANPGAPAQVRKAIPPPSLPHGCSGELTANVLVVTNAVHQQLTHIEHITRDEAGSTSTFNQNKIQQPVSKLTGLNAFNRRILLFTFIILLLGAGILSYMNLQDFRREFEPSLHRKAETLGDSVRRTLITFAEHGIQPTDLRGLNEYLETVRSNHPEVGYLAFVNPNGELLAFTGTLPDTARDYFRMQAKRTNQHSANIFLATYVDTQISIQVPTRSLGQIHVGQERSFIDHQVREVWWDLGTVVLVAMLIVFELLLFAIAFFVHAPLSSINQLALEVSSGKLTARIAVRSRNEFGQLATALNSRLDSIILACQEAMRRAVSQQVTNQLLTECKDYLAHEASTHIVAEDRLSLIRWPFFLFIFAESLSLSFLPLYVRQLYTPVPGWSSELLLGLPISIFMLVWALSLPAAGAWSDRIGRRRAFFIGALIAAGGLALAGTAYGIWDLILWRSLTALGYGIVFITAQGYVVDYTPPAQRTRGMAMFLATFFGGSLCGAAIGGILAERLGYAPVFWISSLLAVIAAMVAQQFLLAPAGVATSAPPKLRGKDVIALLRQPRFLAITLFTAIPSKAILTGFLYYAMPLYLSTLALNSGDVGRVMMTYGLAMIFFSPLIGYLADIWGRRVWFVALGGLFAAFAILLVEQQASVLIAVLGIILLGTSHAIGVPPQLSLVMDVSRNEIERLGAGTVMGIFRLLERLGNVLGPIIVALLVSAWSFTGAFLVLGWYSLGSVAIFAVIWLIVAYLERINKLNLAQYEKN